MIASFLASSLAAADPRWVAGACFVLTIVLYLAGKRLYARFKTPWLMPLIVVPGVLAIVLLVARIPYQVYFADTRWLMWLLGPTTVAFAVPIYEYREIIKRHWFSLAAGVTVGIIVAVSGSFALAKLLHIAPDAARSLLTRSVSTPFALAVSDEIHAPKQLTALFVIATGVIGIFLGELVLLLLPLRTRLARGALFGLAAHAIGTTKAREIGSEEGVISSLTMMIAGVVMVLIGPFIGSVFGSALG